jgi:hypothetical protein
MSESFPSSDAGPGHLPPPSAFDPSGESALEAQPHPPGTVILLLAAGEHVGWAADAAIALSASWARNGRRVVLADLHLENPSLHDRLGAANLEGMVDVFLYGASISRSARPVRGRGFYLISAGTYEPDAEAIYGHPRWPKLVAGFREASASLLLFAPAEAADLEALSRWVDGALLLGSPADPRVLAPLVERGIPVDAVLLPPGDPELERIALPGAERPARSPEPVPVPAAPRAEPAPPRRFEDPQLLIPPEPDREEPRGRCRGWLIALVVLVAMGVLAAVGYYAAVNRPDLFGRAAPGAGLAERLADGPAPAPTRLGEALPFSVQVKAFSSFPAARQELATQAGSFPAVAFFVSPEEVQGVLYHKVMAGLAIDTAVANSLQARLIEAGAIDAEDATGTWSLIRPTPFAFDLGEFPSAEAAGARADSLLVHEVPSYAVAMPYSDGTRRWQLYAGAYPDSISADALRQRLVAASVEPRLVLRIGEPGAGGEAAVP